MRRTLCAIGQKADVRSGWSVVLLEILKFWDNSGRSKEE